MSHLCCHCQTHKHLSFNNVRLRGGSNHKSVYSIVVVAVCLHLQQSDNFCKMQKENPKWNWAVIYMWCFIVLFSFGDPCMCVCYTTVRARGACPLQDYWLLSLFTWATVISIVFVRGTGHNWTAGLVTAGRLAMPLRLWHSRYTFRTFLTWNDVAWLSCFITFSVKNQFRYFAGPQHPLPLTWSTYYTTSFKDCVVLTGKNNSLPVQHHICNNWWTPTYTLFHIQNCISLKC